MAEVPSSSVSVSDNYIESLKRRVEVLEKKLLPQEGDALPLKPLTATVGDLRRKLEVLSGKEKGGNARQVWEKIGQLENAISPEYAHHLKLTEDVKQELLVEQVSQLKPFSERLEEVRWPPPVSSSIPVSV